MRARNMSRTCARVKPRTALPILIYKYRKQIDAFKRASKKVELVPGVRVMAWCSPTNVLFLRKLDPHIVQQLSDAHYLRPMVTFQRYCAEEEC